MGLCIKAFRESRKLTQEQLGDICGISGSAVSQWESETTEPSIRAIERLAKHFDVPKSVILGDMSTGSLPKDAVRIHASDESADPDYIDVPLYGSIAAGVPLEMNPIDDYFPVPRPIVEKYPDGFLLKVVGESMNRKLPNGTYAYVAPTDSVENNKAYAVCVNGDSATIKRVRRLSNGCELIPDSTDPTFKPELYDFGEDGTPSVTPIGRIVYYVIPFDFEI